MWWCFNGVDIFPRWTWFSELHLNRLFPLTYLPASIWCLLFQVPGLVGTWYLLGFQPMLIPEATMGDKFGTRVSCAETAEPIEMLFCWLTHVGPGNNVLDGRQDWTNLSASTRADQSAMQPFYHSFFLSTNQQCQSTFQWCVSVVCALGLLSSADAAVWPVQSTCARCPCTNGDAERWHHT